MIDTESDENYDPDELVERDENMIDEMMKDLGPDLLSDEEIEELWRNEEERQMDMDEEPDDLDEDLPFSELED